MRRCGALAAEWTACLVLAVLQHPYLFVMTLPAFVAAVVKLGASDRRRAAAVLATTAGAVTLVLLVCGYVPSRLPADPGQFGRASMNLMSLVVPFYSGLLPSVPDPGLQEATGLQWDGHNFLGMGVLGLLALAVAVARRELAGILFRHRALVTLLLALAAYAPSNRWFLSKTLLFEYEIPAWLSPLAANFRATGRFFWPMAYAVLVAASVVCARRLGVRRGSAVLLGAGLAQLVDGRARAEIVSGAVARAWPTQLDWAEWTRTMRPYGRVDLYPSYGCWSGWPGVDGLDALLGQEREIEYLAATQGKRTSGGKAARPLVDCDGEGERIRALLGGRAVPTGHLVVLMKAAFAPQDLDGLRARVRCSDTHDTLRCAASDATPAP